jgi:GNAT superfamily N-acetyltransferase
LGEKTIGNLIRLSLNKGDRIRLARAFRDVRRVDLSIDCVIEAQMGEAFVDDPGNPTVYQIQVGPFTYLAGDANGPAGRDLIQRLTPYTFIMATSPGWVEALGEIHEDKLRPIDRYNFSSGNLSIKHLSNLVQVSPFRESIKRMDRAFVEALWGREHFIDLTLFDSPLDFAQRGIGYYVAEGESVIGAAYSQLVCSQGIEVSIYVQEAYRRQRLATALGSCLLRWCLDHNMDPHWDAANPESCKLALKLGYQPAGSYEAYVYLG